MYKHILIPTDGFPLSAKAIEQGVALAKSLGAKVTGVTVSTPFHTFALDPLMVSDTRDQYKKDCDDRAEKFLGAIRLAAQAAVCHARSCTSPPSPTRGSSTPRSARGAT